MTKMTNYVGPCTTACKPGAGTGKASTVFESITVAATEHTDREAGLPGRADRETIACRSCGCETTNDRICDACAEALRVERAEALSDLCRRHGVTCIEAVPRAALVEHQRAWGRC